MNEITIVTKNKRHTAYNAELIITRRLDDEPAEQRRDILSARKEAITDTGCRKRQPDIVIGANLLREILTNTDNRTFEVWLGTNASKPVFVRMGNVECVVATLKRTQTGGTCYNCGVSVSEDESECPDCGDTYPY